MELTVGVELYCSGLKPGGSRSDGTQSRWASAQDSIRKGQSHPFAKGSGTSTGRAEVEVCLLTKQTSSPGHR